ncbi:hypothetical protein NP493_784g00014 [Ridgeia piscesae]|uniref:MAM domain-containing protein n=1 Tax=Ridgeia piscesae TaxID=27915 RepID=A0AAD9NN98_RIDPI|nr:hypothetical protein NP493_784g00014 [Ridgeia piscesae]
MLQYPWLVVSANRGRRYALFVNHDHKMGSKATLGSPWFGSSGPQCHINFTVNMYGTNVGHLRLHLLTDSGVDREVWYSNSDKGSRNVASVLISDNEAGDDSSREVSQTSMEHIKTPTSCHFLWVLMQG